MRNIIPVLAITVFLVSGLNSGAAANGRMPGNWLQFMGWGYGPGHHAQKVPGTTWNPRCGPGGCASPTQGHFSFAPSTLQATWPSAGFAQPDWVVPQAQPVLPQSPSMVLPEAPKLPREVSPSEMKDKPRNPSKLSPPKKESPALPEPDMPETTAGFVRRFPRN